MASLAFYKTGLEIKHAIEHRLKELEVRIEKRNKALDTFMQDASRLRSYLVRSAGSAGYGGHGRGEELIGKFDISSEEKEEIDQLCLRIFQIEQEMRRLHLIYAHLDEKKTFELNYNELLAYGFTVDL